MVTKRKKKGIYGNFCDEFLFLAVLEIKTRALPMVGKHSTTEPHFEPLLKVNFVSCNTGKVNAD